MKLLLGITHIRLTETSASFKKSRMSKIFTSPYGVPQGILFRLGYKQIGSVLLCIEHRKIVVYAFYNAKNLKLAPFNKLA